MFVLRIWRFLFDDCRCHVEILLIEARERGGNGERDVIRSLERMAELERVVAQTTEYLNAKEMKLDTMREVNRSLTEEVRRLAERSLEENDV